MHRGDVLHRGDRLQVVAGSQDVAAARAEHPEVLHHLAATAALAASICSEVFKDEAVRAALKTSVAMLLENQSDQGHFPSEHFGTPDSPSFADLVYTQNWATLGLLHASRALDDAASKMAAVKSLDLLARIQDASAQPWLAGCWRGLYDLSAHRWGGGDLSEAGANSIYSGWTNVPIAPAFPFWATGESLLP
jgi:hypothetical protein